MKARELRLISDRVRDDRIDSLLASLITGCMVAGVPRADIEAAIDRGHREAGRL